MSPEISDPDAFLTVRVPRSLVTALRELADANERTVAGEIRIAIRDRLALETGEAAFAEARDSS